MNNKKPDAEIATKIAELRAEGHQLWKDGGEYLSLSLKIMLFGAMLSVPYFFLQGLFPMLAVLFVITLWLGITFVVASFVVYGYSVHLRSKAERINSEILRLNPDAPLITSRAEEFGRSIRAAREQRNR